MDAVRRLFRALVSALADDPGRLNGTFEVAEVYQTIVPYRSHRVELQMDSIEDYEMAVLRLLSGQDQLVQLEPAEAQQTLRAEAESVNPDTGLFREFAGARVRLDARSAAAVLGEELRYAPPDPIADVAPPVGAGEGEKAPTVEESATAETETSPVFETVDDPDVPTCPDCHADLPRGRTVTFCPYCARQLQAARCRVCGDEVEPGWQYCVTCGNPMAG